VDILVPIWWLHCSALPTVENTWQTASSVSITRKHGISVFCLLDLIMPLLQICSRVQYIWCNRMPFLSSLICSLSLSIPFAEELQASLYNPLYSICTYVVFLIPVRSVEGRGAEIRTRDHLTSARRAIALPTELCCILYRLSYGTLY
jgi:hypothetical protein